MDRKAKIFLSVWVILWILFTIRPLIKTGLGKQYGELVGKGLEARRAIVYGKDLYALIDAAKRMMLDGATYKIVGIDRDSVDLVRSRYYLYPNLESNKPDFILVYHAISYTVTEFRSVTSVEGGSLIFTKN